MRRFLKDLTLEIKTICGFRKIPLCATCKYYMKNEKMCGIGNNINYITGKPHQYTPIEIARLPSNCGHVGYYYEEK